MVIPKLSTLHKQIKTLYIQDAFIYGKEMFLIYKNKMPNHDWSARWYIALESHSSTIRSSKGLRECYVKMIKGIYMSLFA
jgi:hypothetical protein